MTYVMYHKSRLVLFFHWQSSYALFEMVANAGSGRSDHKCAMMVLSLVQHAISLFNKVHLSSAWEGG